MVARYKCHKEVLAIRIKEVKGDGYLYTGDPVYNSISVGTAWIAEHKPQAGGYFVIYENGYANYSSRKAFEEDYTVVDIKELRP